MVQSKHSHSKSEHQSQSKEKSDQSKPETQQSKQQILHLRHLRLMMGSSGLQRVGQPLPIAYIAFLLGQFISFLKLFLVNIQRF